MYSLKLVITVLSIFHIVLAMPTVLTPREDWKIVLGWDGKVTTPVELDPTNFVKPTSAKRAINGGVYFCTDADFKGNCVYVNNFNSGQCVGVGPDFNDDVSSFGPDKGMSCTIYSDGNCNGRQTGGVINPGINNLADFNNNDAMSSFSCSG